MATIMTKRGQLDNVVTYEHICDTVADMANINPSYVTLGSVCIVIKGENDDLEVYMADSRKEWKIISSSSGESSGGSSSGIHICAQDEYDSVTGMPTIEDPLSNTFYLTPGGSETNDLYNEWIWLEDDEEWEKFGSATTTISQSNWNQSDSSADDFIKNKPAIRQQANGGILENGATDASGQYSHAEGDLATASGVCSHAEGGNTNASGVCSHTEGGTTAASGNYSHAEGGSTTASGYVSHAEGGGTTASGASSHAEGGGTTASGDNSHAEGGGTIANHFSQHVFGMLNVADTSNNDSSQRGNFVEIVGNGLDVSRRSNARTLDWEGNEEVAGDIIAYGCGGANPISLAGLKSHVDTNPIESGTGVGSAKTKDYISGNTTYSQTASGLGAFAEGERTSATGEASHAEGSNTTASGNYSHAEGAGTKATDAGSHAEGRATLSKGYGTHAEGQESLAIGNHSHAEGKGESSLIMLTGPANATTYSFYAPDPSKLHLDSYIYSTARNILVAVTAIDTANNTVTVSSTFGDAMNMGSGAIYNAYALGMGSHVEGKLGKAVGDYSHVEGTGSTALSPEQHVQGKYNVTDADSTYVEIVGNGASDNARSNARTLDWSGNEYLAGDVYVGCDSDSTDGTKLARVGDIQVNGTSIISNGVATIPMASASNFGVIRTGAGLYVDPSTNITRVSRPSDIQIKTGTDTDTSVAPAKQHISTFYGLAKAAGDTTQTASANTVGNYTNEAKAAIKDMLGITEGMNIVTVSGTAPTINAASNTQYLCGEVLSLNFTPSATGICDVIFTSGSTQTVLTMPATVKMPEWFEVEANKIYEISITNGVYGAVMVWENA